MEEKTELHVHYDVTVTMSINEPKSLWKAILRRISGFDEKALVKTVQEGLDQFCTRGAEIIKRETGGENLH